MTSSEYRHKRLGAGIAHVSVLDVCFHRQNVKITLTNGVPLEIYALWLSENEKKIEKNSNVWKKIRMFRKKFEFLGKKMEFLKFFGLRRNIQLDFNP